MQERSPQSVRGDTSVHGNHRECAVTKGGPVLAIGLAMAFGLFGLTFRGARAKFWERMTLTGFLLGTMALGNDAELRRLRFRERDIALGLLSAGGLYALFQAG